MKKRTLETVKMQKTIDREGGGERKQRRKRRKEKKRKKK